MLQILKKISKMQEKNRISEAKSYILSQIGDFHPLVGCVLGTGLGDFANHIDVKFEIPYSQIPNMPISTVQGHAGKMIFGTLSGKSVVAMQGRFHFYEGYTMLQVVFPIRVMASLGIKYLFVSNAAGGLNTSFSLGDVMIITDHINLLPNPLIGPNIDSLGERFPDMHNAYDRELIEKATTLAEQLHIKLQYGVYVADTGPSFETPAEYHFLRVIGGDAAGMSTVPEVIAARHMGLKVFGVSVITNIAQSYTKNTHEDVQAVGRRASNQMAVIFKELIKQL